MVTAFMSGHFPQLIWTSHKWHFSNRQPQPSRKDRWAEQRASGSAPAQDTSRMNAGLCNVPIAGGKGNRPTWTP